MVTVNEKEKEFVASISLIDSINDNPKVKIAFYYIQINKQAFKEQRQIVYDLTDHLENLNFSRAHSSHMLDGVFGTELWGQKMMYTKMNVLSTLLTCVTSGHRLLKFISLMKHLEDESHSDWKAFKKELQELSYDFRIFRNALEHINDIITDIDAEFEKKFYFTRLSEFHFLHKDTPKQFNFANTSHSHLERLQTLYDNVLLMLEQRPRLK